MLFESKDKFLEWANSDEGKLLLNPYVDSKNTQAIKTYTANHPNPLELGSRLDEIESKIRDKDSELNKQKLNNFIIRKCFESNLDPDMLEGYAVTDEKSVIDKIEQLSKLKRDSDISRTNYELAGSIKPSGSMQTETSKKSFADFVLEAESRNR